MNSRKPRITLAITATPRPNGWQIGSMIVAALINAALFFGAGALYERRKAAKQAPQPRVRFHVSELEQKPPTGRETQKRGETGVWL